MFKEFKDFISRGSVIELAIAVIIGTAFGRVIDSLIKDIIMPPIGLALGGVDFSNLFINLTAARYETLAEAQRAGAPTINYGVFINEVITFLIVAFVIFLLVREMNRRRAAAESKMKDCPHCVMSIPLAASRCPHCTSLLGSDVL